MKNFVHNISIYAYIEDDFIKRFFFSFAKKHLADFNDEQLTLYDRLINLPSNDWDIYNWAIGHKETLEEFVNHVMDLLRQHARNEDRGGMLAALPRAFTFYLKPSRDEIYPKFQLKWQKMFN